MKLLPQSSRPGLWTNPQWQPGTPGAFAVIIGVSNYDHLTGGQGRTASQTHGLGQLGVSAYTAYKFFCWLGAAFRCSNIRLAKCWLLLSPNAAELAFEPKLGDHQLLPLMENCEEAIGEWHAEMKQLDKMTAEQSRSFFFFSGHGLQVTEDKQILLPKDYLKPPTENVNRALSTENLSQGVKNLTVPYQFFFLDACRNDHNNLGQQAALDGTPVLNVNKSSVLNPDCYVPLFYASASGTQAWQPPDPSHGDKSSVAYGTSVFGQALLEGLQAQAGIKPDCSTAPCRVNLYLLEPFVKNRVTEILKGYQATVGQRIRARGDYTSEPITEVDYNPAQSPPPPPSGYETKAAVFNVSRIVNQRQSEFSNAHEILGSENMTYVWTTARLCRLPQATPTQPDWLPPDQSFGIRVVERDTETRTYRVYISPPDAARETYWLQFSDTVGNTFGCVLPPDEQSPDYVIELDLDYSDSDGGPRPISRVDVSMAGRNSPQMIASRLWEEYQMVNVVEAADAINSLEWLLAYKKISPLAANVGGLILLRARRWDKLHNWLRNVANWFPYLPDGAVLWVEQLLRQSKKNLNNSTADDSFMRDVPGRWEGQPKRVVDYLASLLTRGLPTTGEALGYAARQVDMFLNYGDLNARDRASLERVQQMIREALPYFRSGGLFSVFAGPASAIHPGLVQGRATVPLAD
jgi:hypothetical protein